VLVQHFEFEFLQRRAQRFQKLAGRFWMLDHKPPKGSTAFRTRAPIQSSEFPEQADRDQKQFSILLSFLEKPLASWNRYVLVP